MAAIFQPCSFWFGQKKSHSLLEITLKQRVHPELWLAEFHPTSVLLGEKNGITLLCSCFLSTGHDMMLTLSLDIQGWFFVENFKDICQLWLDFRHYWRYMYFSQVHRESLLNRRPNQWSYLRWIPLASLTILQGLLVHLCLHPIVCLLTRRVVISGLPLTFLLTPFFIYFYLFQSPHCHFFLLICFV